MGGKSRNSENRHPYRAVVEDLTEVVARYGPDGAYTFVNEVFCRYFGKAREELLGTKWHPRAVAEDVPLIEEKLATLSPANPVVEIENRVYAANGEVRWMQFVNRGFFDKQGRLSEIQAVGRDITERKRIEEALLRSEAKYRAIFENSLDAIFLAMPDGTINAANHSACQMFGMTEEELINAGRSGIIDPADERLLPALESRALTGSFFGEMNFVRKDGRKFPAEVSSVILESGDNAFVMLRDISARKKAEAELLERQNALLKAVIENTSDIVFIKDFDGRYLLINPAGASFLGKQVEEVIGRTDTELFSPNDAEKLRVLNRQAVKCDKLVSAEKTLSRGGETRYFHAVKGAYCDAEGKVIGTFGISREITERKKADTARDLAHERFQRIIESNVVGIVIANAAGDVLEANDYYLKIIGYSREELEKGKVDWRAITPPEWLPVDEKALAELRERGVCTPYEKEYVLRDGSRVPVFITDTMLPGPGRQIAAFVLDISERKKTEQELAEKSGHLSETNTALKVVLDQRDKEKKDLEANFAENINGVILPYLEKIRKTGLTPLQEEYMHVLEANLRQIVKPYSHRISVKLMRLSPAETRIMGYIKQGYKIKDIASLLNISPRTVESHRDSLRKKLGIKSRKINLKTYLASLE